MPRMPCRPARRPARRLLLPPSPRPASARRQTASEAAGIERSVSLHGCSALPTRTRLPLFLGIGLYRIRNLGSFQSRAPVKAAAKGFPDRRVTAQSLGQAQYFLLKRRTDPRLSPVSILLSK